MRDSAVLKSYSSVHHNQTKYSRVSATMKDVMQVLRCHQLKKVRRDEAR